GVGWLSAPLDRRVRDGEVLGISIDIVPAAVADGPGWTVVCSAELSRGMTIAPARGASPLGEDVVVAQPRAVVARAPAVTVMPLLAVADEEALVRH
ncbi:MAG: hypothetical protein M3487_06475, partial [Actinomycetota bacterium]|nr:hypothetical protein [Actinomycetota bacterium]